MNVSVRGVPGTQAVTLTAVLAAHAAVLYGLAQHAPIPAPVSTPTVYGYLIEPPPAPVVAPVTLPPVQREQPRPVPRNRPRRLAAKTDRPEPARVMEPVVEPEPEPAAMPEPVAAVAAVPVAPAGPVAPAQPVMLGNELAVACPERTAPEYPALSLRLREEGRVVLRVELDERGLVTRAQVQTGSGSERLDRAAQEAVSRWRCDPARRDGRPVAAQALQPFDFVIGGR